MKIVSLFSGAGGLDLGFKIANHNIVWANDNYADAVATYKNNIGDHIVCDSIENINANAIPDCDIVIGGFPCQGFSVANMKRHEKDERNKLYLELIKVIKEKKPKFFVAENVKGLISLSSGEVFQIILNDFKSMGYKVSYKIMNAADYGVPQTRVRVIIVGVRNDINYNYEFPVPTHDKNGANGLLKWVSVSEAIQELPDPDLPNNLQNHEYSKFKIKNNGYIGHRKLDPEKPAPTVTARGDSKGGVVILPHPNAIRRMSCRELAVIQSFPIDFVFKGNNSSIYRQIGNAVPPMLGRAIADVFNNYKD